MKKLIFLLMIVMLSCVAHSQPWKRIPASNPDYRWQQDNTFEKDVTRCNSSGTVTDTLGTKAEIRSAVKAVDDKLNDTLSLVTNLDSEQLVTLVNGDDLHPGLMYYLTDRQWLLIATSTDVLVPVSGELKIMNGDSLPTGVEPEILLIDTGVIPEGNYNYDTGDAFVIIHVDNYTPVSCETLASLDSGSLSLRNDNDIQLIFIDSTSGHRFATVMPTLGSVDNSIGMADYKLFINNNQADLQAIIEFHRSHL